jgi:hypothetical protein
MTRYFGTGSTLTSDATTTILSIPNEVMTAIGLLNDPAGASVDRLAIALINVLFKSIENKSDDPDFVLASSSPPFPGRLTIGELIRDTYDFSIQARVPSSSSDLPDPDY